MSANVESMFSVREKPWQGLETIVMETSSSEDALKLAGEKYMIYEEFKENILEKIRDFYGESADVDTIKINKNNGLSYEGIRILHRGAEHKIFPLIRLDALYEAYSSSEMDMEECVKKVCSESETNEITESMEDFVKRIRNWDFIRKSIYPILLTTKDNGELLEKLVSVPMLDLSVAYIIRMKIEDGTSGNIKITRQIFDEFKISPEELHRQAMENLKKDGYVFCEIEALMLKILNIERFETEQEDDEERIKAYVLTNASGTYGAAGILNEELLRQFAGDQDYFILPSSIHETIFVPATDMSDKETFDNMVAETNSTVVDVEERLSDHCYFYDGGTGKIRMCA